MIRLLNRIKFRKYPKMYYKYRKMGFMTPSKKVEFLSHRLQQMGHDALPVYHEPVESLLTDPEHAATYPLILTTGAKIRGYVHSQMRNIPSLNRQFSQNIVEMHPDTAAVYGVEDGDMVLVESPQGRIKCQASLTEDIRPRVVQIFHGFEEANANLLTSTSSFDPITGSAPMKSLLCRVEKV